LFAKLPDEDLRRVCEVVAEEIIAENDVIFTEGDVGDKAYVIVRGEIDILKSSGGQMILLATRTAGEVIGEMSMLDKSPRSATGRARTECKLLSIGHKDLSDVLDSSPSAAREMLSIIAERLQRTELLLRQSEKMAQLGTLTAGIAHELNNPASAVRRGSEQLGSTIADLQQNLPALYDLELTTAQWGTLADLQEHARTTASHPTELDSLARSDREEETERWLEEAGIESAWEIAPVLVSLGYSDTDLEERRSVFPGEQLAPVLRWVCTSFSAFNLLAEINEGATRIGEIIKSLKSYVYLDQGAVQTVDLHEGLNNTLVMLRGKTRSVDVRRNYAANLPTIQAYGGELNQVWTNLIDNAVDAMDGTGVLTITTTLDDGWVSVDIQDSGPGIPEDVQEMLFSPFFTTKPLGKGTGLGLNISFNIVQKHNGQITVSSRPGETRFTVRLPIDFNKVASGSKPGDVTGRTPGEEN